MDTVHRTPTGIAAALAALRLKPEQLTNAMLAGEASRDRCTAHHPPGAPGFYSWADTVKELRDILVVNGWRADDDGNFSVVVEPEGKFAIAVATGDEATGTEKAPKTKYEKGVRTLAAVEQNQMLLFVEQLQKAEQSGRETWVLLRRRDPGTHTLMAELSLPAGVVGNRIVKWSVRIILDPIDLDPNPNRMTPSGGDGGGGEDVDVPVTRRTSN